MIKIVIKFKIKWKIFELFFYEIRMLYDYNYNYNMVIAKDPIFAVTDRNIDFYF